MQATAMYGEEAFWTGPQPEYPFTTSLILFSLHVCALYHVFIYLYLRLNNQSSTPTKAACSAVYLSE